MAAENQIDLWDTFCKQAIIVLSHVSQSYDQIASVLLSQHLRHLATLLHIICVLELLREA